MRVPVTGLVGRPGERRSLVVDVAPEEFGDEPWGPTFEELVGDVALDLTLESITEGILVRGTVRVTPRASCARCLTPVLLEQVTEVTELHRATGAHPTRRGGARDAGKERGGDGWTADWSDDGEEPEEADVDYELVDADTALELDRMVRDAVVVGQPVRVLCRPNCAGLCPSCGADRNTEVCDHGEEPVIDPRWEALRGLRLPGTGQDDDVRPLG
jgi:uncharacterized protein